MITVDEADLILRRCVRQYGVEPCPLGDAAGRILREEVRSDRPLPPYDRVAMDGIAVRVRALEAGARSFACGGIQRAGAPALALEGDDGCVEVTTGAVLPAGADCIIRREDLQLDGATATLVGPVQAQQWRNVHRMGSDRPEGAVLLEPGTRLGAVHIGIAASAGKAVLSVGMRPRIAVVSTGDELCAVTEQPLPYQVRRSNGDALRALLQDAGLDASGPHHFPDDEARLRAGLAVLLRDHDVLVLSGGVSMGRYDHVPAVLEQLGVEKRFHRVRQQPGKPIWFGVADGGAKLVFGLPGNPVSALVCAARYVVPALLRAYGHREDAAPTATLAHEAAVKPGLTTFIPVRLRPVDGRVVAEPVPINGSGDFAALAGSDGFVEVTGATCGAGSVVPCYTWR
jgi:molybdopterin molybdotransferase